MKKLIALLLVVCMVAGLFIGCKKKTKTPTTDPTATESTEPTEAVDATDGTEAPDATGETGATESTEAPEETEGAETGNKKPTAATKNKTTKATTGKTTKATTGKTTKATQAAATKATTPKATQNPSAAKSPYKGKTLQIYGLGTDETYQDMKTLIGLESTGVYPYMERAAIVEWAELNGVTIEFKGSYDQSTVLAAINAGEKPDVIFQSNFFPGISSNSITAAFTNAEYKKLAEVCGDVYLDMMQFGTKSHGVVRPWVGASMLYYNADMFKDYGVKTPKEYFLEGNWTWDTFYEVMQKMTKDTDGDGTIDSYGIATTSIGGIVGQKIIMNDKGEYLSIMDEPYIEDFFRMKYDAVNTKKCCIKTDNKIQTSVIKPYIAMQISDCEPYNWQHLYQYTPDGQLLEVAPIPEWRGENGETMGVTKLTQSCFHMVASCDEREAVIDMMVYLLKCGLKYMSDYSLGTVDCEYEGLQGSSEYSKKVLDALNTINKNRMKKLVALGDVYDADYVTKMNNFINNRGLCINLHSGTDIPVLTSMTEITEMPPESAIPACKTKYQNALDAFNNTYMK